jgi:single-stranded DNA-binding protein
MRGVNRVIISGNVSGNIHYGSTGQGSSALSFSLASDRKVNGSTITAWVKVNVYLDPLVRICKARLDKGGYILVEGELMNRDGVHGELTEVRAREIIFL